MTETVLITAGLFLIAWGIYLKRPFPAHHVRAGWTLSHMAWVCGGPGRVLDTWWLALRAGNWLVRSTSSPARWRITDQPLPTDPWLAKALGRLPKSGSFTHHEIFRMWGKELGGLHGQLHAGRLVLTTAERRTRHLTTIAGAILLVGAAFFGHGLWSWVCGSAALGTVLALMWMKVPYLTGAGEVMAVQWRREHRATTSAPSEDNLALAVAIGGTAVLVGTPFNAYAAPLATPAQQSGSSSGCGSSSAGCGSAAGSWSDASTGSSGGWATGGGVDGGGHSSGCGSSSGGGSSGCGGGGCGGGGCGG